jgi:hypothetical protein
MRGTITGWLTNWQNKDLVFSNSNTSNSSNPPAQRQRVVRPVLPPTTPRALPPKQVHAPAINVNETPIPLRGRIVHFETQPWKGGDTRVKFKTTEGQHIIVQGKWPNAARDFEYSFECRKSVEVSGREVYHIFRWGDTPMSPCPVKALAFKLLLTMYAHWLDPVQLTLQIAKPFLDPETAALKPLLRLRGVEIPISHITENYSNEKWYSELALHWKPIRYKALNTLSNFWMHKELHEFHLDELEFIRTSLKADPLPWFLHGYTGLGLSTIPLSKSGLLRQHIGSTLTQEELQIIAFYNAAYDMVERTKCRALKAEDLKKFSACPKPTKADPLADMRLIQSITITPVSKAWKRAELFIILFEKAPISAGRYYLTRHYRNYQTIQSYLLSLMRSPPEFTEMEDRFPKLVLHHEQAVAVQRIATQQNVLIVIGDAGAGKSRVGQKISGLYPSEMVLPLAMYGEVANKMRLTYGRGMTIDMCLERVKLGNKMGKMLRDTIQVVIIDEIGVVTDEKLAALFIALPNVKKWIGMGDDKQLLPVGVGPVLKSFKQRWGMTPMICELVENHRVDANSELLLENFRAYSRGDIRSIQYTTEYADDHPFHLIQRFIYPEHCIFPEAGELSAIHDRMMYMRDELLPIHSALVESGANMQHVCILAQRGFDVKLLNQAWFMIEHANTRITYKENTFYPGALIRFLKNMTYRKQEWNKQIYCHPVSNNTTARIKEIYDIDPNRRKKFETAYKNRKQLTSTADKKINEKWYRVITFEDGTQINLHDYPLNLLAHGYAKTATSAIGSETETIIAWIQPRHVHVYRETLYTMMTRARKTVYLICDFNGDATLEQSDIGQIYHKPSPEVETTLPNYIPHPDEIETLRVEAPDLQEFQLPPVPGRLDPIIPGFEVSEDDPPLQHLNNDEEDEDEDEEDSGLLSRSQTNDGLEYMSQANSRTDTCSSTPSPRAERARSFVDEDNDDDGMRVFNTDANW